MQMAMPQQHMTLVVLKYKDEDIFKDPEKIHSPCIEPETPNALHCVFLS